MGWARLCLITMLAYQQVGGDAAKTMLQKEVHDREVN